MGVMGQANQNIPGSGAGEPYLTKDELIRERTPLAITNVVFDPRGSRQHPNPRWLVTVEAWDDNFQIPERAFAPDKVGEKAGLLSFNSNPTRDAQFESVQQQLEDMRAQGTEWIGPVAVIAGKSANNMPFKTLADVKLQPDGTIVTDSRGFPMIEGEEPAPLPPAPVPAVRRGTVAQQSTGQRERAAAAPQTPATTSQAAQTAPTAAPRVSRSARKPATAPEPPAAPAAATPAAAPRRQRAPRQEPTPDAPPPSQTAAQHEATQRREATRDGLAAGPGPGVQERVELSEATAPCPHCGVDITGRTYPASPEAFAVFYSESAKVFGWPDLTPEQKAAGGQSIPHPNCPVLQRTIMLPVVEFAED